MKSTKIIYWVFTILLAVLMLLSAFSGFKETQQGVDMMKHLGYFFGILRLLSVAKILGVIAILVPGFPRLKEWAYAGFTFDLTGAIYAGLYAGDSLSQWLPVIFGLILVFGSYIFYHKMLREQKMPKKI
jgi:hypothetical protein